MKQLDLLSLLNKPKIGVYTVVSIFSDLADRQEYCLLAHDCGSTIIQKANFNYRSMKSIQKCLFCKYLKDVKLDKVSFIRRHNDLIKRKSSIFCKCDCGKDFILNNSNCSVVIRNTRSCGCNKIEMLYKRSESRIGKIINKIKLVSIKVKGVRNTEFESTVFNCECTVCKHKMTYTSQALIKPSCPMCKFARSKFAKYTLPNDVLIFHKDVISIFELHHKIGYDIPTIQTMTGFELWVVEGICKGSLFYTITGKIRK